MREQHASATITFDAETVKHHTRVFALFHTPSKVFPLITYQITAAETTNRNYHDDFTYVALLAITTTLN